MTNSLKSTRYIYQKKRNLSSLNFEKLTNNRLPQEQVGERLSFSILSVNLSRVLLIWISGTSPFILKYLEVTCVKNIIIYERSIFAIFTPDPKPSIKGKNTCTQFRAVSQKIMAKHISHFHEVLRCKQNVSTAVLELFLSRNS